MNTGIQAPSFQSDAPVTGGHAPWLVGSLIWIAAGFLFAWLGVATNTLATALQPLLVSTMGFSDELLAYRVAFTLIRLPLTALVGILVALAQCAVVPAVRPLARRWLIASAVGGAVSAFVLLPSSLALIEIAGNSSPERVRTFLALWGPALFGGFISLFEQRTARGRLWVPAWVIVGGVLGAVAGAIVQLLL
jgi:hypothetical protein